jgi:nucleotide-binding universal stress UspA family protein
MLESELDDAAPSRREHAEYVPTTAEIEVVVALRAVDAHGALLQWVERYVADDPVDVQLVTVLDPGDDHGGVEQALGILSTAREELQGRHPLLQVHVKVREGDVVDELLASPGRLLVVGSDRLPTDPADRESVAMRLALRSDRPVVVVPSWWGAARADEVVVAVAADLATDSAIDFAADAVAGRAASLRLVHVTPEDDESDPELLLEQAEIRARQHGADEVHAERTRGDVDAMLRETAAHARLVVLGRPHRSELARRVFGSVVRRVLSRPPAPVAIVPAKVGP